MRRGDDVVHRRWRQRSDVLRSLHGGCGARTRSCTGRSMPPATASRATPVSSTSTKPYPQSPPTPTRLARERGHGAPERYRHGRQWSGLHAVPAAGHPAWTTAAGNGFVVPAPADGSGDGAHVYEYRALDGAGNASATGTCTVNIDTTAPLTTAAGLQANNHTGWQNAAQLVTLTADDALSGVATTCYTIDGGGPRHTPPRSPSPRRAAHVVYWSVDAAGNTEEPPHRLRQHRHHRPDGRATTPTVPGTTARSPSSSTPADAGGSGVAGTQYRLQGSSSLDCCRRQRLRRAGPGGWLRRRRPRL